MKRIPKKTWTRLQSMNDSLSELVTLLGDLYGEAQNHYDAGSEKWTESDAGTSYQEWVRTLDEAAEQANALQESLNALQQEPVK